MDQKEVNFLIKKIQKNQNDHESITVLWNEYGERLYANFLKHFYSRWFNMPLEKEDLLSIIFISFQKAILAYDHQKSLYPFIQYAYVATKSDAGRYVKKFITRKQSILNNYIPQDQCDRSLSTDSLETKYLNDFDNQFKLALINHHARIYNKKFPKSKLNAIIDLKLKDYKINEISRILKLSSNQINYHLYSFKQSIIRNCKDQKIDFI
ncbi:MAG: hypothetical protein ACRCVI_01335 [Mycoplasmoidaceae bacterium]